MECVGAGEVKLMTAVGAWLGLVMTFWLFMVTAILQGICALLLVLLRGSLGETWGRMNLIFYRVAMFGEYLGKEGNVEEGLASPNRRSRMIPFGAMLVLGLCAVAIGAWLFPAIAQKFSRP